MARSISHVIWLDDESFTVEIVDDGRVRVAGLDGEWGVSRARDGGYLVSDGSIGHHVLVAGSGDRRQVFAEGELYDLRIERAGRTRRAAARPSAESLSVPMPARVVTVLVAVGQAVRRGDLVVKLEAMKMELPLRAPRDGTVRSIACREGELVQPGVTLLEIA